MVLNLNKIGSIGQVNEYSSCHFFILAMPVLYILRELLKIKNLYKMIKNFSNLSKCYYICPYVYRKMVTFCIQDFV